MWYKFANIIKMNTPDSNYTPKQHRTGLSRLTKSGGIQKSKTLLELLPNTTPNTRSFKKIYSKPFQGTITKKLIIKSYLNLRNSQRYFHQTHQQQKHQHRHQVVRFS